MFCQKPLRLIKRFIFTLSSKQQQPQQQQKQHKKQQLIIGKNETNSVHRLMHHIIFFGMVSFFAWSNEGFLLICVEW